MLQRDPERIADSVDTLLTYMELASAGRKRSLARKSKGWMNKNPMRGWHGIIPSHKGLDLCTYSEDEPLYMQGVTPNDLSRPIDVNFSVDCIAEGGGREGFVFARMQELPSDGPTRVRRQSYWVQESGKTVRQPTTEWEYTKRHGWAPVSGMLPEDGDGIADIARNVEGACMFSFTAQMHWFVSVGFNPQGPSAAIMTEPAAVVALLRDSERGSTGRRASLLHWVREHHRTRTRGDSVSISRVRRHLRGKSMVQWRGMWVTIHPSADDLDKLETAGAGRFTCL